MAHTLKTAEHYTRQLNNARKQRAALPGLLLDFDVQLQLQEIYNRQIKTAIQNRDTAAALHITVIDPVYL